MTLGENIKRYRLEKGLTQKQLADNLGLAEITIRQYENDKRTPKIDTINEIAGALGIGIRRLYPDFTYEEWRTSETYEKATTHYAHIMDFVKILSDFYGDIEEVEDMEQHVRFFILNINHQRYAITIDNIDMLMEYFKTNIPFLIDLLAKLPDNQ